MGNKQMTFSDEQLDAYQVRSASATVQFFLQTVCPIIFNLVTFYHQYLRSLFTDMCVSPLDTDVDYSRYSDFFLAPV